MQSPNLRCPKTRENWIASVIIPAVIYLTVMMSVWLVCLACLVDKWQIVTGLIATNLQAKKRYMWTLDLDILLPRQQSDG